MVSFISSSVFALHSTEPAISAQLLAFLRVFCMSEGRIFYEDNLIYACLVVEIFFFFSVNVGM